MNFFIKYFFVSFVATHCGSQTSNVQMFKCSKHQIFIDRLVPDEAYSAMGKRAKTAAPLPVMEA